MFILKEILNPAPLTYTKEVQQDNGTVSSFCEQKLQRKKTHDNWSWKSWKISKLYIQWKELVSTYLKKVEKKEIANITKEDLL